MVLGGQFSYGGEVDRVDHRAVIVPSRAAMIRRDLRGFGRAIKFAQLGEVETLQPEQLAAMHPPVGRPVVEMVEDCILPLTYGSIKSR